MLKSNENCVLKSNEVLFRYYYFFGTNPCLLATLHKKNQTSGRNLCIWNSHLTVIPLQTITSLKSVDMYHNSTMLVTFSSIRAVEPVLPINKHLSKWTLSHQSHDYIPSISILIHTIRIFWGLDMKSNFTICTGIPRNMFISQYLYALCNCILNNRMDVSRGLMYLFHVYISIF